MQSRLTLDSLCLRSEFCDMVHKIFIYTREEVERMNPGALNARLEDCLSDSLGRGLASKEPRSGPSTSAVDSENRANLSSQ
jgi:hypothetical protein